MHVKNINIDSYNGCIVKLNLPRCFEDPCVYTGNDQYKSVKLSTLCRNGHY